MSAENSKALEHEGAMALRSTKVAGDQAEPRIAILLAAHNGMEWIEAQLDSILRQTGVRMKVYIGVDPSTDGTLAWCEAMALQHPAIEVLSFDGHSGGAASNFFRILATVDFSAFDYVSLADQDDVWLPGKLARAHAMLATTGAAGYSSNVIAFWGDGRRALIRKSQKQVQWDFLFEAAGPGCTYVMRRSLAQSIQALVRSRSTEITAIGLHDWFIYAYTRAHGQHWFIDEQAHMLYRQHPGNEVGVNSGIEAFFHRARKVLDGWALNQSRLIANLVGLRNDRFVLNWAGGTKKEAFWLCFHAWQCRRRWRDKVIFFLSCIAFAVAGDRATERLHRK